MNDLTQLRRPGRDLVVNQQNPIGAMLEAVVKGGVTAESAIALEKLVDLYERMERQNAAKAFAAAKVDLQAALPRVKANRFIPQKDGTVRSTFANYEGIMQAIDPHLVEHGFSISFNIRVEPGQPPRIAAICKLTHVAGHSETNEFAVRVGSGPPGCSEAQADGAARSYARRGALCDALNIVVDHDTDGRNLGDYISPEQAEGLRARLAAVDGNETRFLKFAAADSFESIRQTKYGTLDAHLTAKERKAGSPKAPQPDHDAQSKQQYVEEVRVKVAEHPDQIDIIAAQVYAQSKWLGEQQAQRLDGELRQIAAAAAMKQGA